MQTLSDIILSENEELVRQALKHEPDINVIDEYGFTPLIEAAIVDNVGIVKLLLDLGADVHLKDMLGSTALQWACENNNVAIAEILLSKGANPNTYNLNGQPAGVMPFLRKQKKIKKLLNDYGENKGVIKDYLNLKMLGHLFELVGAGTIVTTAGELVEVSFEGFMPEVTLAMIANSLTDFQNHFASRTLRRFTKISSVITEVMHRAAKLIRYQQYRIDIDSHQDEIISLINVDPLVIPVCYEGHAITFIRLGDFFVKCDRREDSRLYDNIIVYKVNRPERLNNSLIQKMVYEKQSSASVNRLIPEWLELTPITEIQIPSQISGNCSWANIEACIPSLFFLLQSNERKLTDIQCKKNAMIFFQSWRQWNRDRSLQFCIKNFRNSGPIRQAAIAETLAAILFQACNKGTARDNARAENIISLIANSQFSYVLKNYVRVWAYENIGSEGRDFMRLLERFGFDCRK